MTVYVVTRLGLNVSLTLRGRDTFDVQMLNGEFVKSQMAIQ